MLCRYHSHMIYGCSESPCNYIQTACVSHLVYTIVWNVYFYRGSQLLRLIARFSKKKLVFTTVFVTTLTMMESYSFYLSSLLLSSCSLLLTFCAFSHRVSHTFLCLFCLASFLLFSDACLIYLAMRMNFLR
jgi:hypothetical protein